MSAIRPCSAAVLAAGACAVFVGIAWWAASYWLVWTNDYLTLPQAGRCLVTNSSICRLAAALCTGQHRSFVAAYSPWVVWLGAAALLCGAGPLAFSPNPRRIDPTSD